MEYIVEKLVDGKWYYEGKGNLDYVNRVGSYLTRVGIVFRIREASNENN